jgi:WD40 repeat protein
MPGDNSPEHSEGQLSVWDLAKKSESHRVRTAQWVRFIAISRNGDRLGVAIGGPERKVSKDVWYEGRPREVRVYSFPDMKEQYKIPSERYVDKVELSPNGKLLAVSSRPDVSPELQVGDWEVHVVEAKSLKSQYSIKGAAIGSFSPDGASLAIVGSGLPNRIQLLDAKTGKEQKTISLRLRGTGSGDFVFFPDGKKILSGLGGYAIYDCKSGEETPLDVKVPYGSSKMALSPDGKLLVIACHRKETTRPKVIVWDIEAKKVRYKWDWNMGDAGQDIAAIAISHDGRWLAVGSDRVYVFELDNK